MWIICGIPGTGHDSSTVNNNIAEWYHHRKKERLSWPLDNQMLYSWRILKNHAGKCWTIMSGTVE